MRKLLPAVLMLLICLPAAHADHEPPPAKPQRIKGGESFPPLPLPATPLRRTERKRDPSPPALIGKVRYGHPEIWTAADGRKYLINDWESEKGDVPALLKRVAAALGTRYRFEVVDLKDFSKSPDELPILYFTGHHALGLNNEQRTALRQYIMNGGTVFANA